MRFDERLSRTSPLHPRPEEAAGVHCQYGFSPRTVQFWPRHEGRRPALTWHRPRHRTADLTASRPKPKLKKVLPEVWKLIKPRRLLLGGSFLLMIVNRSCGLVLPASTRYLIDNVM